MLLYHGTSVRHLNQILKEGLKPRRSKAGNWKYTIESNSKAVYLTTAYAIYFAENACRKDDDLLIFEIESDRLNYFLFAPDEDFLEQSTRKHPAFDSVPGTHPYDMKKRTRWFRQHAFSRYQEAWNLSVENMGTCCYYGEIPISAFTRYAIIPRSNMAIRLSSDPVVCPINYQILGWRYKNLLAHIFGDNVETHPEELMNNYKSIKELPRDGIKVEVLKMKSEIKNIDLTDSHEKFMKTGNQ